MKLDVYQIVTDRIVALLEKGTIPWQQTWNGGAMAPRNMATLKEYRGVNVLLLSALGYESPYWLTFQQAQSMGGNVRKGEKGTPVVFWRMMDVLAKDEPAGKKQIPFLRYYTVFNLCQCENIAKDKIPVVPNVREHNPLQEAEQIVAAMPQKPVVKHGSARACYSPSQDRVLMPNPESFKTEQDYYSVLFHELAHATGHESRLNRKGVAGADGTWSAFGSPSYAQEELVAEMGAAFLCGQVGIVERTVENSAAYIASWLEQLKNDRKLIVSAAGKAQRAADFILGKVATTISEPEPQALAA